jgi:hypothetical protein
VSDLPTTEASEAGEATVLQFDDNSLLPMLFGEHDQHLSSANLGSPWSRAATGWRFRVRPTPPMPPSSRWTRFMSA